MFGGVAQMNAVRLARNAGLEGRLNLVTRSL